MIIDLINKERRENAEVYDSKAGRIFSYVLKLIGIALFISVEVFIFISLDKKISKYSPYGTYDFLVLFLFILMFVSIVINVISARKVFFNKGDNNILLTLPIDSSEIVISKAFFILLKLVLTNLMISTPILIAYGSTRGYAPYFYIMAIVLYPLFISLFSIGFVLLLMVPYEIIYKFIKKYDWLQLLTAGLLMIALCFAYQFVLNLFLNSLGGSEIGGTFNMDFIEKLHGSREYLFPVSFLLSATIETKNILSNVLFLLGSTLLSMLLGYYASSLSFAYYAKREVNPDFRASKIKQKNKPLKTTFKALLSKEFNILFKDSSYLFSYTSLLIMQPLLSYIVISSLSSIMYSNLTVFLDYFPELINSINVTLILLFSSVINSSVASSISREGKAIQIIKYIPVDPIKQILAKLTTPIILSSASLLISEIALISGGIISIEAFIISLLIGLFTILVINVLGILIDMKNHSKNRANLSFITSLTSILIPVIFLVFDLLLSYFKMNVATSYLIICGIIILITLPLFIRLKTHLINAFNAMEVD